MKRSWLILFGGLLVGSTVTNAKRCYAWLFSQPEEFITVLELPPVDSAGKPLLSVSP